MSKPCTGMDVPPSWVEPSPNHDGARHAGSELYLKRACEKLRLCGEPIVGLCKISAVLLSHRFRLSQATFTRSTGRRSATAGSGSCAPGAAARPAAGRMGKG